MSDYDEYKVRPLVVEKESLDVLLEQLSVVAQQAGFSPTILNMPIGVSLTLNGRFCLRYTLSKVDRVFDNLDDLKWALSKELEQIKLTHVA